jgi:hypothetical protein
MCISVVMGSRHTWLMRVVALAITVAVVAPGLAADAGAEKAPPPVLQDHYDLVVYGATPGGIAAAVRAAREGLSVLLVSAREHLGGIFSNGRSLMDTRYHGARAPVYDELRQAVHDYYRSRYGADSEQYHRSRPGAARARFESYVMEQLINGMLEREERITIVKSYFPAGAQRDGAVLRNVTFQEMPGADDRSFVVSGFAFADCSYEGDLAAVAGVPYSVGREARAEFNEEHAGRIFMTESIWPPPPHVDPGHIARFRQLNMNHWDRWHDIIGPVSTGEGDRSVQAYNLRTVITSDPANRAPVTMPAGYDREETVRRLKQSMHWEGWWSLVPLAVTLPNQKTYMNVPQIVGAQDAYPEGDWATRRRIRDEHAFMTLSVLYYMQNDSSVPEETRESWSQWGLPRDEFPDNGHLPYEIYVREARRIKGRYVFNENDVKLAPGLLRAPIHPDAISMTDWYIESHAVTAEHVEGSLWEGQIELRNSTYPGQLSFRAILPQGLDNLMVPVCASATHVGWQVIRLEATWMAMAEAAAHATALALRQKTLPARIDPDELVRLLAERGVGLTFFNDIEVDPREPWVPAVQYFGTQGFFGSYEADPLDALTRGVGEFWAAAAAEWIDGAPVDPNVRAQRALAAEQSGGEPLLANDFARMLSEALAGTSRPMTSDALLRLAQLEGIVRISRASALRMAYLAGREVTAQVAE